VLALSIAPVAWWKLQILSDSNRMRQNSGVRKHKPLYGFVSG